MAKERLYVTRPGYFIAAAILLPLLDIVFVATRFYARTKQREALKIDDWLVIPATIIVTGIGIMTTYGVAKGSVAHTTVMPPDFDETAMELVTPQQTLLYKMQFVYEITLPLALGSFKASILWFYLRIFSVNRRSLASYLLGGLIVLVTMWTIAIFFAALFQCGVNIWAFWGSNDDIVENCGGTIQLILAICISGFAMDLAIFLVPIPLIWQLHLSTAKKFAIAAVFLLGSATIVASLLRLIMMARLLALGFSPDNDSLLVVTEYIYWGLVESGTGVIAACLPTCRFLVKGWSWAPLSASTWSIFSSRRSRQDLVDASRNTSGISAGTYSIPLDKQGSEHKTTSPTALSVKETDTGTYSTERILLHDVV